MGTKPTCYQSDNVTHNLSPYGLGVDGLVDRPLSSLDRTRFKPESQSLEAPYRSNKANVHDYAMSLTIISSTGILWKRTYIDKFESIWIVGQQG